VTNQADALQQAVARFGASLDSLERSLGNLFERQGEGATLKDQFKALLEERNQLQSERDELANALDSERMRAGRLEAANEEVTARLESVMGTLKEMTPEAGAEA
jgi:chromosome segregation ATPase